MIIDCISDLHGFFPNDLQGGDLLIIAGDLTARDKPSEYDDFIWWLDKQEYKNKVLIAGNHDNTFQTAEPGFFSYIKSYNINYLCDSGTEVESFDIALDATIVIERKFKIWGSPWTKTFSGMNPHCKAFTVDTDEELAEKWAMIPKDTNILITHCPPHRVFDQNTEWVSCGSQSLLFKATSLKNLKLFCFGHIHEAYGLITPEILNNHILEVRHPITCASTPYLVNCSHVNEHYKPVNKPIRIIL